MLYCGDTTIFRGVKLRTIYFDKNIPKILAVKALKPLSDGIVFSPIAPARLANVPEPDLPGPRWLRLRNILSGICASDIALLFVDTDPKVSAAALPGLQRMYLGHEVVSEVTEVGPDVTRFKVGDRVIMHTRFFGNNCLTLEIEPPCQSCAAGNRILCENASLDLAPRGVGGGWGDGYTGHEAEIYAVPDVFSDEQALMVEPLSVGVHSVLRHPPQPGEHVLVVGCGIVGLNIIQALRALVPDCCITAIARHDHQAQAAERLGAEKILRGAPSYEEIAELTGGKAYAGMLGSRILLGGFDVVYDSIGSSATLQDSLRWARARGAVVLAGSKIAPLHLDLMPVWYQEVTLYGIYAYGREQWQGRAVDTYQLTMELLDAGKLSIEGLITHRLPLSQWREAIQTACDKSSGSIRVIFDFGLESAYQASR